MRIFRNITLDALFPSVVFFKNLKIFGDLTESTMGPGGLQAVTYGNEIDRKTFLSDLIWRDETFTEYLDLSIRLYHLYLDTEQYYELLPKSFRNMIGSPMLKEQISGIETATYYPIAWNRSVELSQKCLRRHRHSKALQGAGMVW